MCKRYIGLRGSTTAWLLSELLRKHPRLFVVCKDIRTAEDLCGDLRFFARDSAVLHLAPWDTLPFEPVSPQLHVTAGRIHVLSALASEQRFLCVAAVTALAQKTLPPHFIKALTFTLEKGTVMPRAELTADFDRAGYQRVSLVEEAGQLAVRGGVIDFAPAAMEHAVRLEFTGDRLERISYFDVENQRSCGQTDEV